LLDTGQIQAKLRLDPFNLVDCQIEVSMQSAWTRGQKDSEGAGAPARKVNYMVSAEASPVTFSAVQGDRWS